jgi:hypothetical protein
MSFEFLCDKCSKYALGGVAHKCIQCGAHHTEKEFAICFACAYVNDTCQKCQAPMDSGRDEKNISRINDQREILAAVLSEAEYDYTAALESIKDAVAKYEADIKKANAQLQSELDNAQNTPMIAGQSLVDAQTALRTAQRKARDAHRDRIGEIMTEFAPHNELYQSARSERQKTEQLARRRFDIEMEYLYGLWQVAVKYQQNLAGLNN